MAKLFFLNGLVKMTLGWIVGVALATNPLPVAKSPAIELLDPLKPVLEHLAYCESRGKASAVNLHDPDTASLGLYQFKLATWNYYIDKYNLFPDTELLERENLIWDTVSQEIVARAVLSEPNGWQNWWTCLHNLYE